jgi:hypothetical protein
MIKKQKTPKSKTPSKYKKSKKPEQPPIITPHKPPVKELSKRYFSKALRVVSYITLVFAVLEGCNFLFDYFKSQHQRFIENTQMDGLLSAPNAGRQDKYNNFIEIESGGNRIFVNRERLINGMDYTPDDIFFNDDNACNIHLKLIDNKIYTTAKIKDLDGNLIGEINENKWKTYYSGITDSKHDDNNFEVIDKRGNVAFRLSFIPPKKIKIFGYVVGKSCIIVLSNGMFPFAKKGNPNYKEDALDSIEKIKKYFNYN